MIDADDTLSAARPTYAEGRTSEPAAELERKTKELEEFRDAGVLTEAELEEQKAKLRWGLP